MAGRRKSRQGRLDEDYADFGELLRRPLGFTFLQFLKWVLVIADAVFCYLVAVGYWQFIATGARSHAYFVAATYLTIALAQLLFLARFHQR